MLARVYDRLSHHDTTAVVDTRDFLSSLIDDLRTALAGERPSRSHPSWSGLR